MHSRSGRKFQSPPPARARCSLPGTSPGVSRGNSHLCISHTRTPLTRGPVSDQLKKESGRVRANPMAPGKSKSSAAATVRASGSSGVSSNKKEKQPTAAEEATSKPSNSGSDAACADIAPALRTGESRLKGQRRSPLAANSGG